jgi:hypothetical protein
MANSNLTSEGIHKRLQIVEIVVFISLVLNAITGYIAVQSKKQVNQVQNQVVSQ